MVITVPFKVLTVRQRRRAKARHVSSLRHLLRHNIPKTQGHSNFSVLVNRSLRRQLVHKIMFSREHNAHIRVRSITSGVIRVYNSHAVIRLPRVHVLVKRRFVRQGLRHQIRHQVVAIVVRAMMVRKIANRKDMSRDHMHARRSNTQAKHSSILSSFSIHRVMIRHSLAVQVIPGRHLSTVTRLLLNNLQTISKVT